MVKEKFKWDRATLVGHARHTVPSMLPTPSVVELDADPDDAAADLFEFWRGECGGVFPETLADEQRDEWKDAVIKGIADAIRESQAERSKS